MKKCHPVLLIATMLIIGAGVLCIPHGCALAQNLYQNHYSQTPTCLVPSPSAINECWIQF